ncbi:polyketide cyclase [Nocardioides sp. Root1257]|uniref:SRPBCC family protein n=1 Tax=unclassified Nocardioides TaxID=2615069 RepID=UPI0006F866CE|nr:MULTISPECIES: SRPBCC family protein [unclassified Nocardioides]KQW44018.1 polyketide cyclase [Nocardioides sp. Root1257]KRC42459.1 polyketide cyclase [Nocardioides sp. Root224]
MEYASIEREIHVQASPEVVFEVVSRPEHLKEWWPDDISLDSSAPGATGELIWGDDANPRANVVAMTVVESDPPRRFAFRWTHAIDEEAEVGNSLLVVFELTPTDTGTSLRMTETGFREMGWEAAVLEAAYVDHVQGWDHFIPRLRTYADRLVASS